MLTSVFVCGLALLSNSSMDDTISTIKKAVRSGINVFDVSTPNGDLSPARAVRLAFEDMSGSETHDTYIISSVGRQPDRSLDCHPDTLKRQTEVSTTFNGAYSHFVV